MYLKEQMAFSSQIPLISLIDLKTVSTQDIIKIITKILVVAASIKMTKFIILNSTKVPTY